MGTNDGVSVVIVGAGVIGLTTALQLVQDGVRPSCITILAKDRPEKTVSHVAGALWECPPYHMEASPNALKWCEETFHKCVQVMREHPESGMHVVPNITVSQHPLATNADAKDMAPSYRESSDLKSLEQWLHSHGVTELGRYQHLQSYDAVVADMGIYLGWLVTQLQRHRVRFQEQEVHDLRALATPATVVVNCTGLFRDDPAVFACKGQVVLVHAPWVRSAICDNDSGAYMIPRPNGNLICGGTSENDVYNVDVEADVTEKILKKCAAVVPSVGRAKVVGARAGLRPERRGGVRVEVDASLPASQGGFLVHNYGHGGSGFCLSWGTAAAVSALVRQCMARAAQRSKL
ncbi:Aste57867_21815 [Aphanomyces stellatus]|uniref:Aste57867_21815 protein n=1 Tax=Aphanomyces stellatus TaxID=120398 RepID=A0A485LJ62_9STRA|nr:hypothetical protein As57867_021746 [Aphanomyces stellatus]VFT98484.1 Aste57867_21815 [Aphanomyces stellatus]